MRRSGAANPTSSKSDKTRLLILSTTAMAKVLKASVICNQFIRNLSARWSQTENSKQEDKIVQ